MNKIKLYIMPPESNNELDKKCTTKLKKFNSERNLFLTNLYNNDINMPNGNNNSNQLNNHNNNNNSNYNFNHKQWNTKKQIENDQTQSTIGKPMSRVERTKSFLKNGFMKRWKSSKELFTSSSSSSSSPSPSSAAGENGQRIKSNGRSHVKDSQKKLSDKQYMNEKLLDNLDEFERNFLLSAGKKILVKELRKNFEKPNSSQMSDGTTGIPVPNGYDKNNKGQYSSAIYLNGAVRDDLPTAEKSKILANELQNFIDMERDRKSTLSRHSFYNTYRNEYLVTDNKHYSSNLSLNNCGNSICDKTLTKAFNKYNNFIKSSSSINLSTIVTTPPVPTWINCNGNKNNQNSNNNCGGDNSDKKNFISEKSHKANDNTHKDSINNKNDSRRWSITSNDFLCGNLKHAFSINSLNSAAKMYETFDNKRMANYANDTQSMIVTNSEFHKNRSMNGVTSLKNIRDERNMGDDDEKSDGENDDNVNNNHNNGNRNVDADDDDVSRNIELYKIYVQCNNNKNNNKYNGRYYNSLGTSTINLHDTNINSKNNQQISQIQNGKLRKCNSVNQIDLDLLKNELDDYIDLKWRSTIFNSGIRSQRRYHFNYFKKVRLFLFSIEFGMKEF